MNAAGAPRLQQEATVSCPASRCVLHDLQCGVCGEPVVHHGHERFRDGGRFRVLDYIATVHDPGRTLLEQRCRPRVRSLWFAGACRTRVSAAVSHAIFDATRAIIICPSIPYLSIDPILSIPGMRAALHQATAPIVAVSPIIGGEAVKGPTAKIMSELGAPVTNVSIAEHYRELLDGLIIDTADRDDAAVIDLPVHVTRTLMHDLADRTCLGREALAFAERLAPSRLERVVTRHMTAGVYA